LISMVNNGAGMVGSQFFITLADQLDFLDEKHTIFGQVTEGFDTLELLNQTICDEQHRPFKDTRISHTFILHDPFDDPRGLEEYLRSRSPSPTVEIIKAGQINLDEELNEDEGKTEAEMREEAEEREAAARAQLLEMVGDVHYADEAPPDNVLFVCKLNPVTTDEDLEIIFSRFGVITCCEIIRDRRTGKSLQYAFIEFDKPESCESAFFKMDNVLIDDRRIHVDFSQSVSKNYQWNKQTVDQAKSTTKGDRDAKKNRGEKDPRNDPRERKAESRGEERRRSSPQTSDRKRMRTESDYPHRANDPKSDYPHRANDRDHPRRHRSPSPPSHYRRRGESDRRRGDDYNRDRGHRR